MPRPNVYVLLVYSLTEQQLVDQEIFHDESAAVRAYDQAERAHMSDTSVEIVLVAADSLETIKTTHGSYFAESGKLRRLDLEALLA